MQHTARLRKQLRTAQLTTWTDVMRNGRAIGFRTKALEASEIQRLEANGNHCDDWNLVTVEMGFDTERVKNSTFQGTVQLARFYGTVLTPSGVSLPTGIQGCLVADSKIENALLSNVPVLSRMIVGQGAAILNCGSIATSGMTTFGCGKVIGVGTESGVRKLPLLPDSDDEMNGAFIFGFSDIAQLDAMHASVAAWVNETRMDYGYIGKGAVVCNTGILRNCWIGANARIDGAAKIRNTFVDSTLEYPSEVYDSVILEGCCLQQGVKVHSGCQAKNSMIMRGSKVGRKALISSSIIGSCCHIEEAEITSSWVGPLVQSHHHSLLISALWPEGRGNLGYGANVGSNHTGRLPDQEIQPGLGQFFGLGCNIKFPANFSESPFSVIATGITTSPQRLRMPFSLIASPDQSIPGLPTWLNEIRPGWCYGNNAFSLQRNIIKYQQRSRGHKEDLGIHLLGPTIARQVLDAYECLVNPARIREVYTEKDIQGLGSNFLRESSRQEALLHYANYLERFALDAALSSLEADPELLKLPPTELRKLFLGDLLRDIFRRFSLPGTVPALVRRWRTLEKRWQEKVAHGQDKDLERGSAIFDDYADVHPLDSSIAAWSTQHTEETARRCNLLLRLLRTMGRSNM